MIDYNALSTKFTTEKFDETFSVTVPWGDIRALMWFLFPVVVRLKTPLSRAEEALLREAFGEESDDIIIAGRQAVILLFLSLDPIWDQYGCNLYFRSEEDFVMALMFLSPSRIVSPPVNLA